MRRGFYFRLAAEGISKNRKFYFPYILTCICMVMMFYIVAYLSMSADFSGVFGGDMLQSMLGFGVFVIGIFSLIFLYYTNSFLIRRRQKEFGLYNILGMGKRNLVKILLWENILTAVLSIAAGLAFGILFSKLAEMAAVKILGGNTGFDMNVAAKPVVWTVVLFLAITLLIMLRMVVSIFRLRPVEMLRSENTGEKPPKANWLLAILGAALLGAAYYLAVAVLDPMAAMVLFFLAVVMVILATYFLFIAGSVALCRLLQKNKRYYYKTKHFISLSSMTYRMKRNGAGLASICILSKRGRAGVDLYPVHDGARHSVVHDLPVRPVRGCGGQAVSKGRVSADQLCRPDRPERGGYGAVYQRGGRDTGRTWGDREKS